MILSSTNYITEKFSYVQNFSYKISSMIFPENIYFPLFEILAKAQYTSLTV